MGEDPDSLSLRYERGAARLEGTAPEHFERDRIKRLRADIDAFRRDLKYLDQGGTFLLAPDAAEIDSYIEPQFSIGLYCFPIEDRAKFDRKFAKAHGKAADFDQDTATRKVARRVLRASAHLFNVAKPNILLPPYAEELDLALSVIMAKPEVGDLDAVFGMIERNIDRLERSEGELLGELAEFDTLTQDRRQAVLDAVFRKIVASPPDFADDMSGPNERERRISRFARADDFVFRTKSQAVGDYDWQAVLEGASADVVEALHDITFDETLVQYLENLCIMLPHDTRTTLGLYADARALAYLAAINGRLRDIATRPIRVQLVTWALSPVAVARAFWPEEAEAGDEPPLVQVRHPKLLAAAIFSQPNVKRAQVESDLERFSEALSLFETSGPHEDEAKRDGKLAAIRRAWEQLDNSLLAWAAPIGARPVSAPAAKPRGSLESIRRVVAAHRPAFMEYLADRIDTASKRLSDAHWAVVQPSNVEKVQADCLLYEAGRCIVLRSREDNARFAIALYDARIIRSIYESLGRHESFGHTLLELTRRPRGEAELRDSHPTGRAETQLLKAALFAILGDNVLAARYCRLARAELGKTVDPYHAGIRAEIFYLAHYAHRCLGTEKRSADEFRVGLQQLENSKAESTRDTPGDPWRFQPRYLTSWMTTCREIAVAGGTDFQLQGHWRDLAAAAYKGCVGLLNRDFSTLSQNDTLETYHLGRVTQNVIFIVVLDDLDIGSWRRSFGEVIHPTKDDARLAWKVMKAMRSSGTSRLPGSMKRHEVAYLVGTFWFTESSAERSQAAQALLGMKADFVKDPIMRRVIEEFVQSRL